METIKLNTSLENVLLDDPKGLYIYRNSLIDGDFVIDTSEENPYSVHLDFSLINGDIIINLSGEMKNSTISIQNCKIRGYIKIQCSKDCKVALTLCNNKYAKGLSKSIICDYSSLILKEKSGNYPFLYKKYTGYKKEYGTEIDENKRIFAKKKRVLNVQNIPQYVGTSEDPALMVGCEATACAILMSYLLKKKITKNKMANYMEKKEPGKANFWEYFIGDIYKDGWGCMSPVSFNTLESFLKDNNLEDYEVLNMTNTPLYRLLSYVSEGLPIIVWCTMGNHKEMYKVKYGSTKWNIGKEVLYWPGNDHSLVIVGYDLNKEEIYLADPEVNDSNIRIRNIYEFENRFNELYSQSIIVRKKER